MTKYHLVKRPILIGSIDDFNIGYFNQYAFG